MAGVIPSLKKGLASLATGSAVRNLQSVGGSSIGSSSAGGGANLRMASGAAMNRQRARGSRKAAAAAAAMAEVQVGSFFEYACSRSWDHYFVGVIYGSQT